MLRVLEEKLVRWVEVAQKVAKEHQVLGVQMVVEEHQVLGVQQVRMGLEVHLVLKVHQGILVRREHQVPMELQVLRAFKEH